MERLLRIEYLFNADNLGKLHGFDVAEAEFDLIHPRMTPLATADSHIKYFTKSIPES